MHILNYKNFFLLIWVSALLFRAPVKAAQEMSRGPLKISADETVSKDRGKWIEAKGNVHIFYELESQDSLESTSNFASFNETSNTGELTGSPQATWKRKDPKERTIHLTAEKIFLEIEKERLLAQENVFVTQADSTLQAQQIDFSNPEKKLLATGGRPEFNAVAPEHKTRISAETITAWTDKKIIQFNGKVRGTLYLTNLPQ